jgi:hypothetical protein
LGSRDFFIGHKGQGTSLLQVAMVMFLGHVPSSLQNCNLLGILTFSPPTYKLCTFEETLFMEMYSTLGLIAVYL